MSFSEENREPTPEERAEELRTCETYKTSVNAGGPDKMFFVDDDLKTVNMMTFDWESNRLNDSQIVKEYRVLKQNQSVANMAAYNHDLVLLLAYSGMRSVEDEKYLFKDMEPYDRNAEGVVSEYIFGKKHLEILEVIKKSEESKSNGKIDNASKIEDFLKKASEEIGSKQDASWDNDEVKNLAIKISCYCLAMITATVKQEQSVMNVLNKVDDYVNTRFYNKATNFRMSSNGLSQEFVMGFGNAVQQTPMVNTMIFHIYKESRIAHEKTKNLLNALLLTRICKHGLPVYTLAAPLAVLHCQADGRVNMMKILLRGMSALTLSSIENFFKFQMMIEMPYKEYCLQPDEYQKRAPRSQKSDVLYWPIARALNPLFLQSLGRKFNPDLICFLAHLNKEFGFMSEIENEFKLPKSRFDDMKRWAAAAAVALQEELNPEHLMDPRVLEEYRKRTSKKKVVIDDTSSIDG